MTHKLWSVCILTAVIFFVAGCLYPQDRLTGGLEALPGHVEEVQQAVDRYEEQHGVLPIKTVDADTPIYQKYVIDFGRLVPIFISDPPPSSFEKGGTYLYVLVDVEEDPTVKLFDLRVTDKLRQVQLEIDAYREKTGRDPRGFEVVPGVFELNDEWLSQSDTTIPSPYSQGSTLPLVMDADGTVFVDYRTDLMRILENKDSPPATDVDIRYLLTEDSLFVPAHSLPYRYEDGEPVIHL